VEVIVPSGAVKLKVIVEFVELIKVSLGPGNFGICMFMLLNEFKVENAI
jgi:hypothetical protein